MKARVSVCIPFYNCGHYITETLNSVFASTYPDLEVIIFNDGSTDKKSLETLLVIEQTYSNLKIIHSENLGVAAARNKIAEIASGEYIAFLDADDQVFPTFYAQAVKVLQQYKNVGFVASWIKEFGDSEKVWVAWNTEFPYLLAHNTLGVCTVIRKAAYLATGGMKSLLAENLEDYECWINMSEKGWLGVVIPELHYFYRIRSDSRLQKSNREQLLYLYELIAALHPELYQDYGAEIYHLLNQNGASWLWDNLSQNTVELNVNSTGMVKDNPLES
ncbi:glycosyltransferase family 2 protein [Nostoc sp.]|uniref:glycosyltransferase family 2 protein n=1 Tax=Nostoc sp. TaxID=1180 RepID=UPI002FFBEE8C